MPRDDLAKIELRTRLLRGIFLIDRRGGCPAEDVLVREFECFESDREILVVEILVPQFPQFILGQFRVEQSADALGDLVRRVRLAAADFFVAILERSHARHLLQQLRVKSSHEAEP